jgi:hypothetical protein
MAKKKKKPKTNIEGSKSELCIYCKGENPGKQGICSQCFRDFITKGKEG